MKIRKATLKDIPQIYKAINNFASQDLMLPRSLNKLYENIRDFWVCEKKGKVCGCCSLHVIWKDLAEIRSLAVIKPEQNKGIGTKLIETTLKEAEDLKIKRIFMLTKLTKFFEKFGFKKVTKNALPRKIWSECVNCYKFPDYCDEVALVRES
ncbi:MAG: GNAT family N-acetyltransferase [Candidatus Nealsonbacteria bacterium RBG_13_36_15]|uniref:GNAT family N-acetyltransferase n=1 Tax=Candidatus Nealsonbacteria bacterium RBG_13_36_15 TaxID=1801660 RepID=A0A1G2DV12_9BACT|nr:MAG: GNAT family N-acetyltransferase [Candidatus Nealsonbacteria bacterium RBG_13_36_15]HJX32103.1 N-acetyltransferase [Thermodesulfobacteriota bacterium]